MKKSFSATMSIKRFAGYFIESFLSIMRWVIHVISVGAWSNPVNLDSLNQLCEEFLRCPRETLSRIFLAADQYLLYSCNINSRCGYGLIAKISSYEPVHLR